MADSTIARAATHPFDLRWTGIGILVGALLLAPILLVFDPNLLRSEASGLLATAVLILVGAVVGHGSRDGATSETAVVGLALGGLTLLFLALALGRHLSSAAGILALVYAPILAMAGGWLGETSRSARRSDASDVDWAWIVLGVLAGFVASVYMIFAVGLAIGWTPFGVLSAAGVGFVFGGFVVGLRQPDAAVLESAIAALGLIALEGVLVFLAFESLARLPVFAFGLLGGVPLAILGGFIGQLVHAPGPTAG